MMLAIILAVAVFVVFSVLPMINFKPPEKQLKEGPLYTEYLAPPSKDIEKPEDDLPPQMRKIQKMAQFVIPQIVINIEEESSDFSTESHEGDTTSDGNSSTGSSQGTLDGGGSGNPDAVYTYVEEAPQFPGGESARMLFLRNNIKYPQLALQNKIQGRVYVSFIIEKDGSLTNMKVLQGIGAGCDEEALRVARLMPKWKPGKTQGHEVRVVVNMPVNFILQMSKT